MDMFFLLSYDNSQGWFGETFTFCCQNIEVLFADKTCFRLGCGRLDAIDGIDMELVKQSIQQFRLNKIQNVNFVYPG